MTPFTTSMFSLSIRQLEDAVKAARTLDECWAALVVTSRDLGFCEAALYFHGHQFTTRFAEVDPEECWSFSVPLNSSCYIHLCVPCGFNQAPGIVKTLAASLRTAFAAKLDAFLVESRTIVDRDLAACVQPAYADGITTFSGQA
jgi:hypothetical protein